MLDTYIAYLFWLQGHGVTYRAINPNSAFPETYGYTDCAGSQCAAMHHVNIATPRPYMNSGELWNWCAMLNLFVPVESARFQRGILLFVGDRGSEHVAVSLGNNEQWAAHGVHFTPNLGPASFNAHNWSGAARIPYMTYGAPPDGPHQGEAVPKRLAPDVPLTAAQQPNYAGKRPQVVAWDGSPKVLLIHDDQIAKYGSMPLEVIPAAFFASFDIDDAG